MIEFGKVVTPEINEIVSIVGLSESTIRNLIVGTYRKYDGYTYDK